MVKEVAMPITGNIAMRPAMPIKIKGLRFPHLKVERSEIAPAMGCASIAMMSPLKVISPRYVFFCVSAAKSSTMIGSTRLCMHCQSPDMPNTRRVIFT